MANGLREEGGKEEERSPLTLMGQMDADGIHEEMEKGGLLLFLLLLISFFSGKKNSCQTSNAVRFPPRVVLGLMSLSIETVHVKGLLTITFTQTATRYENGV